jgi:hypothetical protein
MKSIIFAMALVLSLVSLQTVSADELLQSVKFRFPIADKHRALIIPLPIIGMDHDPATSDDKTDCLAYDGSHFPFCYNNHEGTDYSLIGGFFTMDHGSAEVVAAADGWVVEVRDGNYDRCQMDLKTLGVTCNGQEKAHNIVVIEHNNGVKTQYAHLKKNSILVQEGQFVTCGTPLGLVGSSGNSSGPHLHFDVIDPDGNWRDPYAGTHSQSFSFWRTPVTIDGLPSGSCSSSTISNPIKRFATNAVICSNNIVRDGAACGFTAIQDAFVCGSESYQCGQELVACGQKTVTDAVACGTKIVTSAAQCGVQVISSIVECAKLGFGMIGQCQKAKSCSVAKSCQVTNYCQQAKQCWRARTCSVAKSCSVRTCR